MAKTKKDIIKKLKNDLEKIKQKQEAKEYLLNSFNQYFPCVLFQNIDYLTNILVEIMQKNNCAINDLEILGDMNNNYVLKIENEVLKIGVYREVEPIEIPKHEYIINSIKTEFYKGIYIEEQEYLDNKWYENLSDDEIIEEEYKLFKLLKEDGIDWTDIKKENIGKDKNENLIVIDRDHLFIKSKDIIRMPNKYFKLNEKYNEEKKLIRTKK